jgi:hypothetical protein
MNTLETTMKDAIATRPDVAAIACMDGDAGLVLGMFVRGDIPLELVEMAAFAGPELSTAPRTGEGDTLETCDEAFVTSDAWVHAFARVPERPGLVVMGVAEAGTNVTLLRAWLGEVARKVGRAS